MARLGELVARFRASQAVKAIARRGNPYLPHDLHPKQVEFLGLGQREALFGGAAGGGKTDALLGGALVYAERPRFSSLILRRTYPSLRLRGSIMDRAREWLEPTDAHWEGENSRWRFPSGATLQFGYCDCDGDLDRYKSAEFHYIGIDELTEWHEGWYEFLFSRLRRLRGDDTPLKMRAATNPDGVGAQWVRERFGIPVDEVVHGNIATPDRIFVPSRAEDNPSLDLEEYEKSLEQMTGSRTSARFQQLRWGRWMRNLEGLVYSYSDERNGIAKPPADLETHRERWHFILGIDYGIVDPCGFCVLGWRDHDPTVYVLEAYRLPDSDPTSAAEEVRKLEKKYAFDAIVGDVGGMGKSFQAEGQRRHGLPIEAAQKQNKVGYIALMNADFQRGKIQVVKPTCTSLLEEWRSLPWAEPAGWKPGDARGDRMREAPGYPNHAADATLYAWRRAYAFVESPAEKKPEAGTAAAYAAEEQEIWERRQRERLREAQWDDF